MSLTSTGLSDLQGLGAGQTTNFIVQIETTLPNQANVIANADALLAVLENEFTVTTGWFNTPSGKFGAGQQQVVNLNLADTLSGGGGISEPGANNSGYGNPINLDSQNLVTGATRRWTRPGRVHGRVVRSPDVADQHLELRRQQRRGPVPIHQHHSLSDRPLQLLWIICRCLAQWRAGVVSEQPEVCIFP